MSDSKQPTPNQPETISDEVLSLVHQALTPHGLSHIQETVLSMCWQGETYQSISEASGYDDNYIRAVGSQLWQNLSTTLGQKVTKKQLQNSSKTAVTE